VTPWKKKSNQLDGRLQEVGPEDSTRGGRGRSSLGKRYGNNEGFGSNRHGKGDKWVTVLDTKGGGEILGSMKELVIRQGGVINIVLVTLGKDRGDLRD